MRSRNSVPARRLFEEDQVVQLAGLPGPAPVGWFAELGLALTLTDFAS